MRRSGYAPHMRPVLDLFHHEANMMRSDRIRIDADHVERIRRQEIGEDQPRIPGQVASRPGKIGQRLPSAQSSSGLRLSVLNLLRVVGSDLRVGCRVRERQVVVVTGFSGADRALPFEPDFILPRPARQAIRRCGQGEQRRTHSGGEREKSRRRRASPSESAAEDLHGAFGTSSRTRPGISIPLPAFARASRTMRRTSARSLGASYTMPPLMV